MRCKRAQNSLGQLQISCSTNWAMPAKMRRETSAESQLRQEMPNRPRVSFRSKKQPRVKRSTGTGIIDAVDTCTPKMMLVQTKKMFVTAEPIKKGVFPIFPTRLFYFCHLGDSRARARTAHFTFVSSAPISCCSIARSSPDQLETQQHRKPTIN